MRVVILNECTTTGHFGTILVIESFLEQLKRVDIELLGSYPNHVVRKEAPKTFERADLVLVNGEGTIHDDAAPHLLQVAERYPSVLVNCVFQNNTEVTGLDKFLYRAARESLSAEEIRSFGVQCDVIPDIILTSDRLNSTLPKKGVRGTGVTDCARHLERGFNPHMNPDSYINRLMTYRKVVCGRFHAALSCAVLGIPLSLYPSNTWKNQGLAIDMGIPHLHKNTPEEAKLVCPDSFPEQVHDYVARSKKQINQFFEGLHDIS